MATPNAVEKQALASEQAISEFEKAAQVEGDALPLTAPPDEDGKNDEDAGETQNHEPNKGEDAAGPVTPTPPSAEDELKQLRDSLAYEKHRNDSLQGRLDSQLRPLNDQVRELKAQVTALSEKRLEPKDLTPPHLRHVKPEEVESFGKDAVDVQSRIAQGVAESAVEELSARDDVRRADLEKRLELLEQERQQLATSEFWGKVEKQVPGAKRINDSDPKWIEFLNSSDPLSGRMRRELGEVAIQMGDVRRVVDLLYEFTGAAGAVSQPKPAAVKPEVVRASAPATRPAAGPGNKAVIKESQIKRFYDDWARGKFAGKEKEAERISAAIDAAVEENRVVRG